MAHIYECPEIIKDNNSVLIKIDLDQLVFASENRNDVQYKVNNKMEFMESFMKELKRFQTQNSKETGITALQEFIDLIVDQVAEDGTDCIEVIDINQP